MFVDRTFTINKQHVVSSSFPHNFPLPKENIMWDIDQFEQSKYYWIAAKDAVS